MVCNNCGNQISGNTPFCTHCGKPIIPPAPPIPPIPGNPFAKGKNIPREYSPLSPWAYFGLSLLFNIPIVGFVMLIVFSFNKSNINRRNFARSYWCAWLILGAFLVIALLIMLATGFALNEYM